MTDDGKVIVASDLVAKEAEAAAINSDRNCLAFRGHLKVWYQLNPALYCPNQQAPR